MKWPEEKEKMTLRLLALAIGSLIAWFINIGQKKNNEEHDTLYLTGHNTVALFTNPNNQFRCICFLGLSQFP